VPDIVERGLELHEYPRSAKDEQDHPHDRRSAAAAVLVRPSKHVLHGSASAGADRSFDLIEYLSARRLLAED
jgi:hypothetical protein